MDDPVTKVCGEGVPEIQGQVTRAPGQVDSTCIETHKDIQVSRLVATAAAVCGTYRAGANYLATFKPWDLRRPKMLRVDLG